MCRTRQVKKEWKNIGYMLLNIVLAISERVCCGATIPQISYDSGPPPSMIPLIMDAPRRSAQDAHPARGNANHAYCR